MNPSNAVPWKGEKRTKQLWLPVEPTLYAAIRERTEETGFSTVSDYVRTLIVKDMIEGKPIVGGKGRRK
ncbi:MAG: hypothetical protein V1495_06875 [Pseudomonadota bacterium]